MKAHHFHIGPGALVVVAAAISVLVWMLATQTCEAILRL